MTLRPVLLVLLLAAGGVCAPSGGASAFDFKVQGESLRLDLTESMFLSAHLDNGNGEVDPGNPGKCLRGDCTDDNYGEIINRLNAQLAWKRFLFSVRFDTGAWVHAPNRDLFLLPNRQPIKNSELRFRDAGTVAERGPVPVGVNAFYLEKISASYIGRSVELTLGDFYVNLGRGLVLSIRKIDELGVDTTVTGAKLIVHEGDWNAVVLAGFTNAQNIDQTAAQWIADPNDFIAAAHVDYRLAKKATLGANVLWGAPRCTAAGTKCDQVGFADNYQLRPGLSLDAPKLTRWLGLYAEYVRQQDRHDAKPTGSDERDGGNAFYGAANLYFGDVNVLLETKYYDHYLVWHGSNDPFGTLAYMVPPTLERIIVASNDGVPLDVLAGRARVNVRFGPSASAFVSAQAARNRAGAPTDTLLDMFIGAELRWDEGRSHFFPLIELRDEHQEGDPARRIDPGTEERLIGFEWDLAQELPKRFSLELQGLVWLRQKLPPSIDMPTKSGFCDRSNPPDPTSDNRWCEGQIYASMKWASKVVASVGYEFTTKASERANQHDFINASILWNITPGTSLVLFGGGNRSGLKCVSGVCRNFPAFQGMRLELVVRL